MDNTQRLVVLGVISALTYGMLLGQVAPEAETSTPGAIRIVFLRFAEALQGTEESKVKITETQAYVEAKNRENDAKSSELETLKSEFSSKVRLLNPQAKAEMQREITKKERDLTRYREDIPSDIDGLREQLFAGLTQKMQLVIGEASEKNGYSAVLFVDQMQGYFNPEFDITADIIERYNARYPLTQ